MNSQERGHVSAAAANLPVIEQDDRLSRLFVEHYRRVLTAAYRIAGNLADAEDVAQGVFLRLGRSPELEVANAGSYLYRAAINGALDLVRHRKSAATESLESAASVFASDAGSSPEIQAAGRELAGFLRKAISELPARWAEMFVLRYVEELDNREIAKLTRTSAAVVAVTLHQIRSRLKKKLIDLQRGKP